MSITLVLTIAVLALAAALFVFRAIPAVQTYFAFRGKRLITCPETEKWAAVEVSATEAAEGVFLGEPTLNLRDCSRWPERWDCGQDCLKQIEVDPENCLVWNIVSKWYEGKNCVFCHKPIGVLHHLDHAPALLSPEYRTVEWDQLRAEELPNVLTTFQPVCWNCHVTETFRRLHPEMVVERKRSA
ncbi:MAG TPA: hypothetical protein VFO39_10435 [Candidatus Sulfotelmatobacter sp.]|nr:hypothetical protein [Candidatus Sulfotelmatobacter sp.]